MVHKFSRSMAFSGILMLFIIGCSTASKVSQYYTGDDKQVFALIERLRKNPNDKEAAETLPGMYRQAADLRRQLTTQAKTTLPPGDRYMDVADQLAVMAKLYEEIKKTPAASEVVPNPWDPTAAIAGAKEKAADEYYNEGVQFLAYNNRPYAAKAYDMFSKANAAVPGFKDVTRQMSIAQNLATIKVIVNPVNYNNYGFGYWGFQNDFLQNQMVNDLNSSTFNNVKFYTDWNARAQHIQGDRIVDLNYTTIRIGQIYSNTNTIKRSAQVQVGTDKANPPKPIYKTVYATVFVTTRVMESRAVLQCRIYDMPGGNNIMFDSFPGVYNWTNNTATYRGDQRALTPADWNMINNSYMPPPSRSEIADRLIRESYNLLLSRIRTGVSFN
ncbi:hypothetical protein [Pollutibacter soli]|uniref:hypothetical protein n=1 Tax=Pollutibacter soli TaxID=3034157 RepID=UPI00301375C6